MNRKSGMLEPQRLHTSLVVGLWVCVGHVRERGGDFRVYQREFDMAHDGSYEVEWKGNPFPFLMHHPNGFHKSENYGSAKAHAHGHENKGGQRIDRLRRIDGGHTPDE